MKILIADDHWVSRKGIGVLCDLVFKKATLYEAASIAEIYSKLTEIGHVDLFLSDNFFGDHLVIDSLKDIRTNFDVDKIIIISAGAENVFGIRSIRAGANGYVNKSQSKDKLMEAVDCVMQGKLYASSELLLKYITQSVSGSIISFTPFENLSDNEFKITIQLLKGKTTTEIANEYKLALSTISTYKSRILLKLKVKTENDMRRLAIEHHLFPDILNY